MTLDRLLHRFHLTKIVFICFIFACSIPGLQRLSAQEASTGGSDGDASQNAEPGAAGGGGKTAPSAKNPPFNPKRSSGPVTDIHVTTQVIASAANAQPMGLNMFGDIGAVKYANGNLIRGGGFEPINRRVLYRVISSGVDGGKHWITLDGSGTTHYQLWGSGFYSGGNMRAYRVVDASGNPLPYTDNAAYQGGKILNVETADRVILVANTKVCPRGTPGLPDNAGGWQAPLPDTGARMASKEESEPFRDKWKVYYEGDTPLLMDDVVIFEKREYMPELQDLAPRMRQSPPQAGFQLDVGKTSLVPHAGKLPKGMDGGESCLLVESTDAAGITLWRNMFTPVDGTAPLWYGQLEPGVKYRYEAWMKQEGMSAPQVQMTFSNKKDFGTYYGTKIGETFTVDSDWKLYGFEFIAPERPVAKGNKALKTFNGPTITFTGTGKLYMDNLKLQPVYAPGDEAKPFVVNQTTLKHIVETQPPTGRKGALRIWSGLTFASMKSWLSWEIDSVLRVSNPSSAGSPGDVITLPKALLIAEATGNSPETRMVPWIITQVTFSEEEYKAEIEYLAAPYDPAKDTPASKPYAYMRTQQRGNNTPWTDTFRELIIEFGNENWHNRKNEDWVGFGRYGGVHQFGKEYGLFTRYYIEGMKKSPYWNNGVADKIHFCLGGNYTSTPTGYGQLASMANKQNTYQGMAIYTGPKWELNEAGLSELSEEGWQQTLISGYQKIDSFREQAKTIAAAQAQGAPAKMAAYECGPSGFDPANRDENTPAEIYGHSLAMGSAAFDAYMYGQENGWTYMNYLGFGQGMKWSSHTSFGAGFQPSPGFQALMMRNLYMTGDMYQVDVPTSPTEPVVVVKGAKMPKKAKNGTITQPGKAGVGEATDTPMIAAHAMGAGSHLTVSVNSRSFNTIYPVKIHLPPNLSVKKITCHELSGDPRTTYTDIPPLKVKTSDVPLTQLSGGTLTYDVPPAAIVMFEFE